MKNFRLLKNTIKENEGFRDSPYFDQLGHLTIGYGHLVRPSERFNLNQKYAKISLEKLFEKDFNNALNDYNKNYKKFKYNNRVSNVLIEMIFQVGISKQKKFKKMNEYIQQNKLYMAAYEMKNSLWYSQTPKRINKLIDTLLQKK